MPQNERRFSFYTHHEWKLAGVLFASYVLVFVGAAHVLPAGTLLSPASAVALGTVFFGGIRLWPVLFLAAFFSHLRFGAGEFPALFLALVESLQVLVGAYVLRRARIDPLFRRYRDTAFLILTVLGTSLIQPAALAILAAVGGMPQSLFQFGRGYAAMLFSFLVLTPFILRWFAKPRFSRSFREIVETIIVFAILCAINYALFVADQPTLFGLPLMYLMLVPLFWISLRLRPRFVTLALLATACMGVWGALDLPPEDMGAQLLGIESFLITLSIIFYIIVSLEEDRRLNTNLMRSQLSMLENAVTRISSESNAKNDFIAVLAHELRNPLAPIVSAIDYLRLTGTRDRDELETLDMMDNRMKTVRRLLDDLLDVSKISEGKLTIKKEHVDLDTVLRRAIISTTHHIKERHQNLVVKGSKNHLEVLGDPVRLEQVFSNLLTNASKYSDPGDQITVTMRSVDGSAQITVADQGIGIPSDALEHIFEPFHQIGSGIRTQKGLGIGLALVRSFVTVHRGTITAMSEGTNKGSVFTVTLPLIGSRTHAESHNPRVTELVAQDEHTAARVLIVDYSDATAWSTGRLLELQKFDVDYVYDLEGALEFVTTRSHGTVLIALDLPDQEGYKLAHALREGGFAGRIIGMARNRQRDVRQGEDSGFDEYIAKPAEFADLKRVMPEII